MITGREFTTREAAALTDVPQNRIQKFIDAGPIPKRLSRVGRRSLRVLSDADLVFVWVLVRAFSDIDLTGPLKAELYERISEVCAGGVAGADEVQLTRFLSVHRLGELLEELRSRIERLEKACSAVESNPAIKGGEPIIKGTRIPVHLVAALLDQGASVEEIIENYPTLDEEKVELARVYAGANPKTGRPANHPWR